MMKNPVFDVENEGSTIRVNTVFSSFYSVKGSGKKWCEICFFFLHVASMFSTKDLL